LVVSEVRSRFGLDIVVLRILAGERPMQTPVTYLAELLSGDPPTLSPWSDPIGDDPLRLPYARPGGPAADLAWASTFVELVSPAVQVRTWNLSSIWRLPTADGMVWLKHVPPFFAHESSMLRALGNDARVPRLIAGEPGRMLLADVPGQDCYEAEGDQLEAMLDTLISLQNEWVGREDDLLALGAPDWRRTTYLDLAADVVARGRLPTRRVLDAFVAACRRSSTTSACGVPTPSSTATSIRATCGGRRAPGDPRLGDVGGTSAARRPAFMERRRACASAAALDAAVGGGGAGKRPERGRLHRSGRADASGDHLPALPRRHRGERAVYHPPTSPSGSRR
jgi:hypothetical protein